MTEDVEEQPKRKRIRIRQAQQQTLGRQFQIMPSGKIAATEPKARETRSESKIRLREKLDLIHRMLGR